MFRTSFIIYKFIRTVNIQPLPCPIFSRTELSQTMELRVRRALLASPSMQTFTQQSSTLGPHLASFKDRSQIYFSIAWENCVGQSSERQSTTYYCPLPKTVKTLKFKKGPTLGFAEVSSDSNRRGRKRLWKLILTQLFYKWGNEVDKR